MAGKNRTKRQTAQGTRPPKGRHIGYARVSTSDQELNLQMDELQKQGCRKEHIFVDQASGLGPSDRGWNRVSKPFDQAMCYWSGDSTDWVGPCRT